MRQLKAHTKDNGRSWDVCSHSTVSLQFFIICLLSLCLTYPVSHFLISPFSGPIPQPPTQTHIHTHGQRHARVQWGGGMLVLMEFQFPALRYDSMTYSQFSREPTSILALPFVGYSIGKPTDSHLSCLETSLWFLVERQVWFWTHLKAHQVSLHHFVLVTWELAWGDALNWHDACHGSGGGGVGNLITVAHVDGRGDAWESGQALAVVTHPGARWEKQQMVTCLSAQSLKIFKTGSQAPEEFRKKGQI